MEGVRVKLNPGLPWKKLHLTRRRIFLLANWIKFEEETSEVLRLEHSLYGAEIWTLRATDQKHPESFEMWCRRRMEKISWTDHVRNEELLLRVNDRGISYMK